MVDQQPTCHTEVEHSDLVAQTVGHIDLVEPRVCGVHPDQEEGPGGGGTFQAGVQLLQDHGGRWNADRLAADGDVLSLRDHRRWEDMDSGVPGRSWSTTTSTDQKS